MMLVEQQQQHQHDKNTKQRRHKRHMVDDFVIPSSVEKISELEERVHSLEREISSSRDDYEKQLMFAKLTISQLEEELSAVTSVTNGGDDDLIVARMTISQLEEELGEVNQRNASLEDELVVTRMTISQLEEELTTMPTPMASGDHFRLCLHHIFSAIQSIADTDTEEGRKEVETFFNDFLVLLASDIPVTQGGVATFVSKAKDYFDIIFKTMSEMALDNQNAHIRLKKAKKILSSMRDELKDSYEKSETLVRDHQAIVAHCKETDQLFNEAADKIDFLTEENKNLRIELNKTYDEMEVVEREVFKVNTRLKWRSQAEEQGYAEDAKKLQRRIADLRSEKEAHQTTALQNKRTADGLGIHIKTLRDELARLRRELLEARTKIPRPTALIEVREIGDQIDKEINDAKRAMVNDPNVNTRISLEDHGKCHRCAVLWIAAKHAESEQRTLELRVIEIQHTYARHINERESQIEDKIKEGIRQADTERVAALIREHKRTEEMEHAKRGEQQARDTLEEMKKMNERRAQAKQEEIEKECEETRQRTLDEASLRDSDMNECGRRALGMIMSYASYASNTAPCAILTRFIELMDTQPIRYDELNRLMSEFAPFDEHTMIIKTALTIAIDTGLFSYGAVMNDSAPTVREVDGNEAYGLLMDVMQPLLMLCSSYCAVDEWRTPEDREIIQQRFHLLNDRFQNTDVSGIRKALFDPVIADKPYLSWVIEHAVGCLGTNDYFANAMKRSLLLSRKTIKELGEINQKNIKDVEGHIFQMMQSFQSSDDSALHVLLRQDRAMLSALTSAVNNSTCYIADAMQSTLIPGQVKGAINALQLVWAFVKKLCDCPESIEPLISSFRGSPKRFRPDSPFYEPGK